MLRSPLLTVWLPILPSLLRSHAGKTGQVNIDALLSTCALHHILSCPRQVNVTADHRIIYGADVAEFLQTLGSIVENPMQLTL